MKFGRIHIYTGEGKGKTTAALGLGLRASCAGFNVCIFQFLKRRNTSSEHKSRIRNFQVICLDQAHPIFMGKNVFSKKAVRDMALKIKNDFNRVSKEVNSGKYDLVVLDELINCVSGKFIKESLVLDLIKLKPSNVELVLTGRRATKKLIAAADYVSRLDKVKHPFDKGVGARCGVEY